jgi:hypothetical protein
MNKIYKKYTLHKSFCAYCNCQIANAYAKCKCNKGQLIKPYRDDKRYYCEKYNFWTIFTLVSDSKIPFVQCEMILKPFNKNEKYYNEYDIDHLEKLKFEFTFTTNDSDITIFEPFIDELFIPSRDSSLDREIKYFYYDNIYVYNPKRIQLNRNSKKKTKKNIICQEEFNEELRKLKLRCEKLIFNELNGKNIKFKQNIAKTLANVYVEIKIKKEQYINEKKDCPHISRRKKK